MSAILLTLALCVAVAVRKIAAITQMSHTTSASVASVKRIAKQVMAERIIVDTEKGPDCNEGSGQSSSVVMEKMSSTGVRQVLRRFFFGMSSLGKSE